MTWIAIAITTAALFWFFILRPGRIDFWKSATRTPDEAYDHFLSSPSWKVFVQVLPEDYRTAVPKKDWVGPFTLYVPKLGGAKVFLVTHKAQPVSQWG